MPAHSLAPSRLRLPVIVAPMFLISNPAMVVAACRQGVVGTFPALNTRTDTQLKDWIKTIRHELGRLRNSLPEQPVAPFGVNLIVHKTNKRLEQNLESIVEGQVPLVITSLGAAPNVINHIHAYGGKVFHDVTNLHHARKAAEAGVDGLIVVCAGAGGHAGVASPFALIPKIRAFFKGTVVMAGAISDGAGIRAAQVLGADLAYMGTRFIATQESGAPAEYKRMILESEMGSAPDYLPVVYTDRISGIHANFLKKSIESAGIKLNDASTLSPIEDFSKPEGHKAWKDIWSAGHGVIAINDLPSIEGLVGRLESEYRNSTI
ncbi:2-nitropropane dioxygenase, NPD [Polychytrium aggregatum]|uniref:2-nitropropane dioxygenase, NPD n=1 Tax=Polychytrium aggregatum TaxID=110093 RepID=UPI0022FE2D23|nr:2-nitropropane dioxygenase, NPD [Polychytrium aggregatum]KAI9202153.1 2-nitropropane dioxygenase, NPD [Polychytrium aggregatum]